MLYPIMLGLNRAAAIFLALSFRFVTGNFLEITDSKQQQCSGIYGKGDWGGSASPYIETTFDAGSFKDSHDAIVSFVVFDWRDEALLGVKSAGSPDGPKEIICDQHNVESRLCNGTQIGEFILQENAASLSKSQILTRAVNIESSQAIKYDVKRTGFYCVSTVKFSDNPYRAVVEFRNPYGQLPAAQIPKLPFYGGLTIVYAVIGAFWAFLYVQNRHDILPVQNYITAIIVFLIIEQLITWGYYDYQNRHGNDLGNKVLLVTTGILNAGRNSFSFFLLLIVCMGYGVVKPSLDKTMGRVRLLALAHFVFGVIYGVATLSITPDTAGPLVLLVIVPLAATLTTFYVWTLNSLSLTMKDLLERKQSVKALMYKRLWWCILSSILVIFVFFFFNSFSFASRSDPDFVPNHWKTRWFILDGWLNLVYLFDIGFIAYLWRPTANNRRFAMSDEIAQDDEGGFEIASLNGSLDEEDADVEAPSETRADPPQHQQAALSTLPPNPVEDGGRRSLDGETIFAVGEDADQKWSDGETSSKRGSLEGAH